jgi:hypothetical protein
VLSGALISPCQPTMQALPLHSGDYSATSRRAWMIGTPQGLDPDDISPFYDLAPMPPGTEQFAVDTTCFRAPAAPQVGETLRGEGDAGRVSGTRWVAAHVAAAWTVCRNRLKASAATPVLQERAAFQLCACPRLSVCLMAECCSQPPAAVSSAIGARCQRLPADPAALWRPAAA